MCQKRIFIGSSSEAKPYAKKIAATLEKLDCVTMPWWEAHVFPAGDYTFDSILHAAHSVDAGVFLLAEDDTTHSRGRAFATTRNNVLLEAGLFYGVLGRSGVGLCTIDSPDIPSDWDGITLIRFNAEKMNEFEERAKHWLKKVKHRNNVKPHNVHMQSREEIHKLYSLEKRLGSNIEMRKHITYIRILNFASTLLINPDEAEPEQRSHDSCELSEMVYSILKNNSSARIGLILSEPTEYGLKDVGCKIASPIGPQRVMYNAQSKLYEFLTNDEVYRFLT